MTGPLNGLKVVEVGGIGPGPFCGMMLADHGAEVVRVVRPGERLDGHATRRSRLVVELDLRSKTGLASLLDLAKQADCLFEVFRPGVAERLGFGPDVLLGLNPRLIYGRMTGWGQDGPYSRQAGHDLNYIALSGALGAIGPRSRPVPPLALVGDMGGGGLMLAFSILAALHHVHATGEGQVIDCAISEGAAALMTSFYGMLASDWRDERESNLLDGAAHFYNVYETKDDKFISIAPIEAKFYDLFIAVMGLPAGDWAGKQGREHWEELRQALERRFRTKTRAEWCELLEATDACFAPVMSLSEAPGHPHNRARETFVEIDGIVQPAPAPRYSRTKADRPRPAQASAVAPILARWSAPSMAAQKESAI